MEGFKSYGNVTGGHGIIITVNPEWTVLSGGSESTTGLNPAFGPQVKYTPTALGDYTLIARFDGREARSGVAVMSYIPTSNTFDIFVIVVSRVTTRTDSISDIL